MELSQSTTPRQWRKSSHSLSGECVEVASDGQTVSVRDFNDRRGSVLTFSELAWQRFLGGLKQG